MTKHPVVIIGAGIHGLSTAWNIGEKLREKGHSVKEVCEKQFLMYVNKKFS